MTVQYTSPVTGAAQTGLTSPTYTITVDTAPAPNAKQWAITGLGGTQTGVTTHSVAAPFTISVQRPASLATLGVPNPSNGVVYNIKKNVYKIVTRKGVTVLAGQPLQTMIIRTEIEVPAGADLADPANVRAAQSLHNGTVAQVSAGLGDTTVQGYV
jgi:hypothetical protein